MFGRKDESPAGGEPAVNPGHQFGVVLHIVEGEGAEDGVETAVRKADVLHRAAGKPDILKGILLPGHRQHLLRQVDAEDLFRPVFGGVKGVPAVTAAEVQHPFAGKVRQHRPQGLPLPGPFQAESGTGHLAVFPEKDRVVVTVFFHKLRFSLKWPVSNGYVNGSAIRPAFALIRPFAGEVGDDKDRRGPLDVGSGPDARPKADAALLHLHLDHLPD